MHIEFDSMESKYESYIAKSEKTDFLDTYIICKVILVKL